MKDWRRDRCQYEVVMKKQVPNPSSQPAEPAPESGSAGAPNPRATQAIAGSGSVDTENAGISRDAPVEVQPPAPPAKTLSKLGDFLLLRKIGSGAMGAVYKAQNIKTGQNFALKVLFKHVAENPKLLERFHREAEVSRSLDHPNIVRGFGSGQDHRYHYFAMEYVSGESLQKWLGTLGKIPLGDALHVTLRCAWALEHAHSRGLVHRDIKPDNILVTRKGLVKIADFGMVKKLDADMSLTQTGHAVGTPWYMPLEQAKNYKDTDGRCDIYALGCVFYALLTGQPPFTGPTLVDVIQAKETGTFRPARQFNREVPERVDLILAKMAAKLPKGRYQSCAELARDLEGLGLAHPKLGFLKAVSPTNQVVVEVQGGGDGPKSGRLSSQAIDTRQQKTPNDDCWFVRYTRQDGKQVVQKLSLEQVINLIENPQFDPHTKASRTSNDGFRALATYKEFEKAALKHVTRSHADNQTVRQRRLFDRIVHEQQEQEKPRRGPVTSLQYWLGILIRASLIAGAVGLAGWGVIQLIRYLR
jgi:serine/threonine-protein kinase